MAKVHQFLILIFSVICLANANCKFDFKENAETELEAGLGFKPATNFKSINIKFPETPTSKLFECASKVDDSVTIEAKYKIDGQTNTKWNDIKIITLQNDNSYSEETLFGPGKAEACSTYKIRLKAKFKDQHNRRHRKHKTIKFETGPESLKENQVIVSKTTDSSAVLDWLDYDYTGCSNVKFQVNGEETNETNKLIENLEACKNYEVPISPIFNGKQGVQRKISVDTFPNKENLGIVQETETEIIFNTNGLRRCNFAKFKILFKIEQLNPDQKSSEVIYKEDQRKGDLREEEIKLEKIKEYLITKKFLKSCGHYLITIVIEVERNNLEPFRFNVIENKPLKSDNELNLHFSDKDICQRRGKSDNTVNNETIVNNTTDLPIEQADENSSEKAPEHSSEKPLEKTHQDLKVDLGISNNNSTQENLNQIPDKKKDEEKSSNIMIIGLVIALLLIILIALAAFLYKRKYSQVPQVDPAK